MKKTLIAIPCMDTVPVDFMTSLVNLVKPSGTSYAVNANSMIYDTRNNLSAKALMNGYDRVLWLDSDMVFDTDLLVRLSGRMDAGLDFVSGLYFKRHIPTSPVIYQAINYEVIDGVLKSEAIPMTDYPMDALFEIAGSGFGCVMTSTALLKDVWEHYGPPFDPLTQMGEDMSFCWRAKQLGHKLWCDSGVKAGHIGQYVYDEKAWISQNREVT